MFRDETHDPAWKPPHCPNAACRYHQPQPGPWPYRRNGFYQRRRDRRRVPRYKCLACRRSFSNQTFSTSYWLKRPELLADVFNHTVGGMANRQIARTVRCAPATVDHHLTRLGRHCMLFQRQFLDQASPFGDIAFDGLVTFEFSQYFPFEHLIAVDCNTSFIIHHTDAPLRRSGRMTARQKKRRHQLEAIHGRPDPQAVAEAVRELLQIAVAGARSVILRSDEHRQYRPQVRQLPCQVEYRQISSRLRRDAHNDLFEINALEMFLRHSSANLRRETIAFSRRRQDAAYRLSVFMVWRNFEKRRWEKRCRQTPAMLLGLTDRVLTADDILRRRLFPGHFKLPPSWERYYGRQVQTPVLGRNRRHELRYAY